MPALAFPPPIWRCRDCNIIHPTDYKVCGKCCKKREEIGQDPVPAGDPNASSDHQAAAAAAMEAAAAWYSTQLAQACPPQGLYAAHAFSPTCGGGGMRPPYALQSPAAGARSKQSRNATRRGENVKDNPQMQKTAREGQKHWHDKVQQVCRFRTLPDQRQGSGTALRLRAVGTRKADSRANVRGKRWASEDRQNNFSTLLCRCAWTTRQQKQAWRARSSQNSATSARRAT